MKNKHLKEWDNYFKSRRISSEIKKEYLLYIKTLLNKKTPIIFEIEHFSMLLGIDVDILNKMIFGTESFYHTFTIPKRDINKLRTISAPYPSLLYVQQWILKNILNKLPVHSSAHAYRKNKSILTNVTPHLKNKVLLKIDLTDYFPNINMRRVISVFMNLGYTQKVSFFLASLCTLDNGLPQGAPTSPTLSNIISYHLDRRLFSLTKKYNCIYTRYADDIAITGDYISLKTKSFIISIIEECGFIVNQNKTYLSNNTNKRILTGISISNGETRIPRKLRRTIKQEIFYLKEYGFYSHINKRKITNPYYLESLKGKITFWNFIESNSDLAKEMLKDINKIINDVNKTYQ